jgi:hypothetical protein
MPSRLYNVLVTTNRSVYYAARAKPIKGHAPDPRVPSNALTLDPREALEVPEEDLPAKLPFIRELHTGGKRRSPCAVTACPVDTAAPKLPW